MVAAAQDEVSVAIESLFSGYGQQYQALSTQAAAFHAQFVQALTSASSSYAAAEAANESPLQTAASAPDLFDRQVADGAPTVRR